MPRDRTNVIQTLVDNRERIQAYGVRRLGLFGSCATGRDHDASDLDFVVEFDTKSFDGYMDLRAFLEDLFRCRVDLVLADAIKPRLQKPILESVIHVPGL